MPTTQPSPTADHALEERVRRHPGRFRMLTGDRPTGPLHLGHYLGTLANRVRLQRAGVETFIVIADLQVVTDRDETGDVAGAVREVLLDQLAAGIDPRRATIFTHSAVPALNQLVLPFLSLVTDAELRRNPTVRAEAAAAAARGARRPSGLLLTYPVHQAADILFCHGNLVPVGRDQLPHVETARLIARRFNERYAGGAPVFAEPEALLGAAPVLLGTDGAKMSKSRGNAMPCATTRTAPRRSCAARGPTRSARSPTSPRGGPRSPACCSPRPCAPGATPSRWRTRSATAAPPRSRPS